MNIDMAPGNHAPRGRCSSLCPYEEALECQGKEGHEGIHYFDGMAWTGDEKPEYPDVVIAERNKAEDRVRELEDELAKVGRSLVLIHTWLGKAMEQRAYRGDFCDCEGLIEDAYAEASERTKI